MSESGADDAAEILANSIVDEIALGLCFEIHRAVRLGHFNWDGKRDMCGDSRVVDAPGVDVFGQPVTKKSIESECPNCSRIMASSRLAPHLEKCLNMGRQSSRVAVQKLAVANTKASDSDIDDTDYNPSLMKKGGKKKHKQNGLSPRRNRLKVKPATAASSATVALDIDATPEQKETFDRSLYRTSSGEWSNSGLQADTDNASSVPSEYLQLDSGCSTGPSLQAATSGHDPLLSNTDNHDGATSTNVDDFHIDVDSYLDNGTTVSLDKSPWAETSSSSSSDLSLEPPKKRKKGRPPAKKSH